jgi:hypothetical protein
MNQMYKVVERQSGKKGPGKLLTIVATKPEGDVIVAAMKAENNGLEYVVSDEPMVVETVEEFTTRHQSEKTANEKRASVLAKLTPEELAVLGIK